MIAHPVNPFWAFFRPRGKFFFAGRPNERIRMTTESRPISSLRPHPRNYRRHPEGQLAILRDSLRIHGLRKPVVIQPDGTILAGHGLVEAARAEGWREIDCHVYDGPNPDQFLVMDNRSADLAEDDAAALLAMLQEAEASDALQATGYGEEDLAALIAEVEGPWVDDNSEADDDRGSRMAPGRGAMVVSVGRMSALVDRDTVQAVCDVLRKRWGDDDEVVIGELCRWIVAQDSPAWRRGQ